MLPLRFLLNRRMAPALRPTNSTPGLAPARGSASGSDSDRPRTGPAALILAGVLLGGAVACAHTAPQRTPAVGAPAWVSTPLGGSAGAQGEGEGLAALAKGTLGDRVVRLDRLLDLFDAARFGESVRAREALWAGLGGHQTGVGHEATRDASRRLLDEAFAIESAAEAAGGVRDEDLGLVSSAIALLSNDLQPAASAEDLSIRALAYREILLSGHPRIADNARWRLYDHARGTLAGAAAAPAGERLDVAVQALYVSEESVEALLEDWSPQLAPRMPTPAELLELLGVHRRALAAEPRWAPIVEVRDQRDAELRQTLLARLPAPRDASWPSPIGAPFTGRKESHAPAVVVETGRVVVDAGRPGARTIRLGEDIAPLTDSLQSALAQDGRGVVLLFAQPDLPATDFSTVLRGIRRAQTSVLELAYREPKLDAESADAGETVLSALPLLVARRADATAAAAGLADARITTYLTGRGPKLVIDGHPLTAAPETDRALGELLERVKAAYPREQLVRVDLASDVSVEQLARLLEALVGGETPRFEAVGWLVDGGPVGTASPPADALLALRAELGRTIRAAEIEQPFKLRGGDQAALEAFVDRAVGCVPELETEQAKSGVHVKLSTREHKLDAVELESPRVVAPAARERFIGCVKEVGYGLRLRNHADKIEIRAALTPASG